MKSNFHKVTWAAGMAATLALATSAYATPGDSELHPMGEAISADQTSDVITITPDTKYVNVDPDEEVKFVDAQSGASFGWAFDTPDFAKIELAAIAPAGFSNGKGVEIYVRRRLPSDN